MELTDAKVIERYKRCLQDGDAEHKRVLEEVKDTYAAYGLRSFEGGELGNVTQLWGEHPPEIAILLSTVNTFLGSLLASRKDPSFPGFDLGGSDALLGEALTALIRAGRRWSGSTDVDKNVLLDSILSGYGFARLALETETRPPFRPDEEFVSADRVWWDPGGHEDNLRGSQEWIVRDFYSIDEAGATFPDHEQIFEALRLQHGGTGGTGAAPREGAVALGGQNFQVSISAVDGSERSSGTQTRRLREAPIDDFMFLCWEKMVGRLVPDQETGELRWDETTAKEWEEAIEFMQGEAELSGQPFEEPQNRRYPKATWYRARILARSATGEPLVLVPAAPIKGDQRLVRALTCYTDRYEHDGGLRTRFFGWGRVLVGIHRLFSMAMRIYIEQEARRTRDGWDVEESAFGGNKAKEEEFRQSRSMVSPVYVGPDGFWDKVHQRKEEPRPHTQETQQMFRFLAGELVSHSVGISDVSRGTFTEDRSAKWMTAMQESALQMQAGITAAYTSYLDEGAVTMARLMLEHLDAQDIDRLIGEQPLKEGLTGQKDEAGELQPIMLDDPETPLVGEDGEPQFGEDGQPLFEQVPQTIGRYLKANVREIMQNDIAFGLKPSAASERISRAMLLWQHGVLENIAGMLEGIPGAKELLAPVALRESLLEGSDYSALADKLEGVIKQHQQQQQQQAQVATDAGWVTFIQQKAQSDFEGASQLMQQASAALMNPNEQQQPETVQ